MLVIPRDCFNHGNLLKCYGQLYLQLEFHGMEGHLYNHTDDDNFTVITNDDGETTLLDVELIDINGNTVELWRPLNSRASWPLTFIDAWQDIQDVFNQNDDDGTLTDEFKQHMNIRG